MQVTYTKGFGLEHTKWNTNQNPFVIPCSMLKKCTNSNLYAEDIVFEEATLIF
jgi:hypothetical protein